MRLDRMARRYNTCPWTVLHWPPERIALCQMAMDAAESALHDELVRRGEAGSGPMLTLDLGR